MTLVPDFDPTNPKHDPAHAEHECTTRCYEEVRDFGRVFSGCKAQPARPFPPGVTKAIARFVIGGVTAVMDPIIDGIAKKQRPPLQERLREHQRKSAEMRAGWKNAGARSRR